jgi:hypothetical protein
MPLFCVLCLKLSSKTSHVKNKHFAYIEPIWPYKQVRINTSYGLDDAMRHWCPFILIETQYGPFFQTS